MTGFLVFLVASATAYFAWRIVDQLPDVLYRLSEIQRDVAELRRLAQADEPKSVGEEDAPSSTGEEDE